MKRLNFNEETYEAERIVKTDDGIIGYIGDDAVFKINGISDFSGFVLDNGQDFNLPEFTLEQQFEMLKVENEELATTMEFLLLEVIPSITGE